MQDRRQPPPSPPRSEHAPTPLTLIYALSCRSGSRSFFDADAVPPMPQPSAVLGWSGCRSEGRCRLNFYARFAYALHVARAPGALGAKNGRAPVAVGPSGVARGRMQAWDSLNLPLN